MDLEALKARKLELEQAKTNTVNSFNIISGHISECEYQISLIEKAVAEPEVLPVE